MPTREELRGLILELLRTVAAGRQYTQFNTIFYTANERFGRLDTAEELAGLEIMHELLLAGVVVFGTGLQQPGYPWIWVTDFGRQCLAEGAFLPYDPDGFLTRVRAELPGLDPVASRYLGEAVFAYNRNLIFASSVMLGVASERLMLLLIEAFGGSLETGAQRVRFREVTRGRSILEQHREFRARLDPRLELVDEPLRNDLDVYLDGIFNLVRIIRNAAGHPTGTDIPRNVLFANIQAFPQYAGRLIALTQFFLARPGP